MELTTTNLVFILFGLFAAALSILYIIYFNGGIQTNLGGIMGILP